MAKDETRRLTPSVLQADTDGFAALKDLSDYAPAKQDYTVAKVKAVSDAMAAAQEAEAQADAAAAAARDGATKAEWTFHNAMLGVKDQVRAQYGQDSDELQGIGLKKKSEKARGGRKGPVTPAK